MSKGESVSIWETAQANHHFTQLQPATLRSRDQPHSPLCYFQNGTRSEGSQVSEPEFPHPCEVQPQSVNHWTSCTCLRSVLSLCRTETHPQEGVSTTAAHGGLETRGNASRFGDCNPGPCVTSVATVIFREKDNITRGWQRFTVTEKRKFLPNVHIL